MQTAKTEDVRAYGSQVIGEARRKNLERVEILAGDVVRALGLRNRTPLVCQALAGRKFLEENGVELESAEGPPSGQGTRMSYTYRLRPEAGKQGALAGLRSMIGVGKAAYQSLGGGETFLRREREEAERDGGTP